MGNMRRGEFQAKKARTKCDISGLFADQKIGSLCGIGVAFWVLRLVDLALFDGVFPTKSSRRFDSCTFIPLPRGTSPGPSWPRHTLGISGVPGSGKRGGGTDLAGDHRWIIEFRTVLHVTRECAILLAFDYFVETRGPLQDGFSCFQVLAAQSPAVIGSPGKRMTLPCFGIAGKRRTADEQTWRASSRDRGQRTDRELAVPRWSAMCTSIPRFAKWDSRSICLGWWFFAVLVIGRNINNSDLAVTGAGRGW